MGELMRRFVEEADRGQWTPLPECLDDFIDESNPVRVIDVFVDALDLAEMSFEGVEPAATGRPSYHPSVLLKLYIYGYLNRVQSSRRLEREAGRNVEVMWLLGRLAPDHKTIADCRIHHVVTIEPKSPMKAYPGAGKSVIWVARLKCPALVYALAFW
jgi:transposase